MFSVLASYRQTLLSHIGSHLRMMELFDCSNIDPVAELLPCTLLDSLDLSSSSLISRPRPCLIDDVNIQFLPSLERLGTRATCLGDWSSLFECPRPLLTHLFLSCSHIGIESKSPLFDWHNIPEMWPNLQVLYILSTLNLTLDKLDVILNQFNKLQRVCVPSSIKTQSIEEFGMEATEEKVELLLNMPARGTIRSRMVFFINKVPPEVTHCLFITE